MNSRHPHTATSSAYLILALPTVPSPPTSNQSLRSQPGLSPSNPHIPAPIAAPHLPPSHPLPFPPHLRHLASPLPPPLPASINPLRSVPSLHMSLPPPQAADDVPPMPPLQTAAFLLRLPSSLRHISSAYDPHRRRPSSASPRASAPAPPLLHTGYLLVLDLHAGRLPLPDL